jgi:hypothetical protein
VRPLKLLPATHTGMAQRLAIKLAAGAATTAIVAAGAHEAECKDAGPPSPSMSMSWETISSSEIEDVSRQLKLGEASSAGGSMAGSSVIELRDLGNGWVAPDDATTRSVLALGKDLARDPRVQARLSLPPCLGCISPSLPRLSPSLPACLGCLSPFLQSPCLLPARVGGEGNSDPSDLCLPVYDLHRPRYSSEFRAAPPRSPTHPSCSRSSN